jgi:hypothetical protein
VCNETSQFFNTSLLHCALKSGASAGGITGTCCVVMLVFSGSASSLSKLIETHALLEDAYVSYCMV